MAEVFEIKTDKGTKVKLVYEPSGNIKVSDKKAFEGYIKKVVNYIEVDGKLEGTKVLDEEKQVLDEEKPKEVKKEKPKPKVEGIGISEELPKPKGIQDTLL
jgi:hypothetical protein